ncbi:MAG: 2,3-bisphosphoglycerate-independent phosphoglycerate mutase, partial [Pseudomonadota bacterium]
MRRVILCILDGWGERALDQNNGLRLATNWQHLIETYPHTFLNASESYVGLPDGQMGNSEVGHMTMGLGRVISQDLSCINESIKNGTCLKSDVFLSFVKNIKESSNCCHVMGLLSQGGVHSHEEHFFYAVKMLEEEWVNVVVHPILDGRDTSPRAASASLARLNALLNNNVRAGSMTGRYFAMDRDKRWGRIEKAYNAFVCATGPRYSTFDDALQASYAANIGDEFVEPCVIDDYSGIRPGDSFFFINFRGDRARQWLSALVLPNFNDFPIQQSLFTSVLTMTDYAKELSPYHLTLFPKMLPKNGLGEVVSNHALRQLRIAETEKYAHVTYFFNGGHEAPFDGEERIMVPSPHVATYDLKPEMSAEEVTEHVLNALALKQHHLIVVNYANPDMVGHTGIPSAIEKAIHTVDSILVKLEKAALQNDWILVITADHG